MGKRCQFHRLLTLKQQDVEHHQQTFWQVRTLLPSVSHLSKLYRFTTREERATQTSDRESEGPTTWEGSISGFVTPEEFVNALSHLKPGKSPVLDSIFQEFILHARSALKSWLYSAFTSYMRQLIIPKIWRRALIVVIPTPNRPFGAQRVIALFCSCVSPSRTLKNSSSLVSNQSSIHYSRKKKRAYNTGDRHGKSHLADARHWGIVFWLRKPELCLSISQQSTTLYGIAASPASYCDCTWESHGPLGSGAVWQS